MAAAYSTGTATDPVDLLQKFVTWLVAQGWTQNMSQADGAHWRAHLSKGGIYANLYAFVNAVAPWYYRGGTAGYGIALYLGDGYSGASAWNAQSGGPPYNGTGATVGAGLQLSSGAITAYHFFDDGNDHVTVVIERTAGIFGHFGWGPSLTRLGYTWDSWYFYGSSPSYYNGYSPTAVPGGSETAIAPMGSGYDYSSDIYTTGFVRVDATLYAYRWAAITDTAQTYTGYTGKSARCAFDATEAMESMSELPNLGMGNTSYGSLPDRAYQSAFTGALLLPLHCFLKATSARWIPLGYPPTVFFCAAVGHGFAAGDVYQVGGLDYMVFPGFAVRKAA